MKKGNLVFYANSAVIFIMLKTRFLKMLEIQCGYKKRCQQKLKRYAPQISEIVKKEDY